MDILSMIGFRLAPALALSTLGLTILGLTGCGYTLATDPGLNSGVARPDYHHIVMAAAAADSQTRVRDGHLHLGTELAPSKTAKPVLSAKPTPDRAEGLGKPPLPQARPLITGTDHSDVATTKKPDTPASRPAPKLDVQTQISDLIAVDGDSEVAVVRQDLLLQADPAPARPSLTETVDEAKAGLPLLVTSSSAPVSPEGQIAPETSLIDRLDDFASVLPGDEPAEAESPILSMTHEELDILLVQLESDDSGYERVRKMTPEEKAKLRTQYEKRSFLGHFVKMDRDNDGALTRQEMLAYFTIMHAAFDVDYDDVVSREEAPSLLLRIKLMGEGFPTQGLTLQELERRLEETYVFLDKNNNDKLGWPELL